MNKFTILFKSKSFNKLNNIFFNGYDSFKIGKKIYHDRILTNSSRVIKNIKIKVALWFFDRAIENGCDNSEVFSLRGSCLNDLGFYFDALDDYNKAIEKNPEKNIANNYFMRSLIKDSIFDFEGSLADAKEALHLSKLDNSDNRWWDNYSKKSFGMSSAIFYEWQLSDANRRLWHDKNSPFDTNHELRKIKRRDQ